MKQHKKSKIMSIIKFLSKEDLRFQPKLAHSTVDKFNAIEQLRKVNTKNIGYEFSIPISFSPKNSGITISKNDHSHKFKFTEFMLPGDALLQKSS